MPAGTPNPARDPARFNPELPDTDLIDTGLIDADVDGAGSPPSGGTVGGTVGGGGLLEPHVGRRLRLCGRLERSRR